MVGSETYLYGYLTIIPQARVGYEMKREWNNCFIKNNQEMLLFLADFAL